MFIPFCEQYMYMYLLHARNVHTVGGSKYCVQEKEYELSEDKSSHTSSEDNEEEVNQIYTHVHVCMYSVYAHLIY